MAQDTAFGKVDVTTYMEVKKVDGRIFYYRVKDGIAEEITKETYDKEN